MTHARPADWVADNHIRLTLAIESLHGQLATDADPAAALPAIDWPSWPALDDLAARFGLDAFERQLLLLATAIELDGRVAEQIQRLNGSPDPGPPTIATLFRISADAHWTALSPTAAIRRFALLDCDGIGRFTDRTFRLDERVLHFLVGVPALDQRLQPVLREIAGDHEVAPSHAACTDTLTDWLASETTVQVTATDAEARRAVAARAARALGRPLYALEQGDVPVAAGEREAFVRLWLRETRLSGALLAVEIEDGDPAQARPAAALIDRLPPGVLVLAREPLGILRAGGARLALPSVGVAERRALWRQVLNGAAPKTGDDALVDRLAGQFQLPLAAMRASAHTARQAGDGDWRSALWGAARSQARPRLDDLAERIDGPVGWGDIVLPRAQTATLEEIVAQVRARSRVYDDWGFREKLSARGLGVTALFSGPSGTGKTMAAEVIANALDLDLYRIDLSAVVSKYIGETEKNLGRIFDAAEAGGVILLFDEADALFGKRSEVKDSHDRYANIEVSYLLQRMEAYTGLALLTTNLKSNLDAAFTRRLRFLVDFPFPGPAERLDIWTRAFPKGAPVDGVSFKRLAQLNVPGGAIRNIALNAAFLAADRGGTIAMADLLRAVRTEYAKLEKPLTEGELKGWRTGP